MRERDNFCCSRRLIGRDEAKLTTSTMREYLHHHKQQEQQQQNCPAAAASFSRGSVKYCQNLINIMTRKLCKNQVGFRAGRSSTMLLVTLTIIVMNTHHIATAGAGSSSQATSSINNNNHQNHQHNQNLHQSGQSGKSAAAVVASTGSAEQLPAQARVGGLDPSDYIDEAGELEVLMNQQQIPTAQLMAAAGHLVPENFFMPGGSIPASLYAQQQQYLQQHQQQQQQQQQHQHQQSQQDAIQQAASHVQTRVVPAPSRYNPAARNVLAPLEMLIAAASEQQQQQHQQQQQQQQQHTQDNANQVGSLIDFNGYSMTTQPDPRDAAAQIDLLDFLAAPHAMSSQQVAHLAALYDQHLIQQQQQQQQQQHQQQPHFNQQQANMIDHLSALASNQQEQGAEGEHYVGSPIGSANAIGPDYQLIGQHDYPSPANSYESSGKSSSTNEQQYSSSSNQYNQQHQQQHPNNQQRPFGLPTKSSSKEPPGMLKPLGNPKTVSSPIIDFAANNLPKSTSFEKLADKLPQHQTPTVFSFSSSKDPSEKVKGVNQKKRNVMRQAEQIAKLFIKSFNDKFGTNLGDQTDIPFLLSTLGPLGFAQNVLLDPTLLISLLNTAEKTYFSDVLPGPTKQAIKPVLNFFRVPNKKRDKANLSNIISYLASGGQTATNVPSKHRQSFGIEKSSSGNKSKHR